MAGGYIELAEEVDEAAGLGTGLRGQVEDMATATLAHYQLRVSRQSC